MERKSNNTHFIDDNDGKNNHKQNNTRKTLHEYGRFRENFRVIGEGGVYKRKDKR